MEQTFVTKVKAAAVAGWWTLLIAYGIILIQWIAYLWIMAKQPEIILSMLGAGTTWQEASTVWLWAIVVAKLCVGMMLFIIIWLSLWARHLARK